MFYPQCVCLVSLFPSLLSLVSPPQLLTTLTGRSSSSHPLAVSSGPLTLWCSSDVPIKKAFFTKTGDAIKKEAKIFGTNATWTVESPTVLDAGDYSCEMETQRGRRKESTTVYVRPVVHIHNEEKIDTKDKDDFRMEATRLTVTQGQEAVISCPVFAHPLPNIKWTKDGKPMELSNDVSVKGMQVRISNADYLHEGVYQCDAINEYTVASKTHRPLTVVSRLLRVKSRYSWVWPLLVIVAILAVLVLVILACEMRRHKREKLKNNYGED